MKKEKARYRENRRQAHYSLSNAAFLMNMDASHLRAIERGKEKPTDEEETLMAKVYLCRVEDLHDSAASQEDIQKLHAIILKKRPKWTPEKETFTYLAIHIPLFALLIFQYVYAWNPLPMAIVYAVVQVGLITSIVWTARKNKGFMNKKYWYILLLPEIVVTFIEVLLWLTPILNPLFAED